MFVYPFIFFYSLRTFLLWFCCLISDAGGVSDMPPKSSRTKRNLDKQHFHTIYQPEISNNRHNQFYLFCNNCFIVIYEYHYIKTGYLDYLQNNTKTKTRNTLHTKVKMAKITSFITHKNIWLEHEVNECTLPEQRLLTTTYQSELYRCVRFYESDTKCNQSLRAPFWLVYSIENKS